MSPLLRSLRPRHWIKNVAVFAGLCFSRQADEGPQVLRVTLLFGCFCLASSAVYLVNDLFDRERDRVHPLKCQRPIASGQVASPMALGLALVLAAAGLAGGYALGPASFAGLAGYLLLQGAYSARLKHVVILDVFCIAAGFMLRVLAGVWTIGVTASPWLVACSVMLALFLALCKRRAEVIGLADGSAAQRPAIDDYRGPVIDVMIGVIASATLVTYTLYTLLPAHIFQDSADARLRMDSQAGAPGMVWTVPLVAYGMLRYLYLVYRLEKGERPELTVMTDRPLLVCLFLYLVVVAAVIYLPRPA